MSRIAYILFSVAVTVITIAIFYAGRRCTTYFSNNSDYTINERFFDIECKIYPGLTEQDSDILGVNVIYKNEYYKNVKNLKIQVKDAQYGNIFQPNADTEIDERTFRLTRKKPEQINIILDYDVNSSGSLTHKQYSYYNLKRITFCRENFALH